MLQRIVSALWGKFESKAEMQKFGFLATIFGLIIGTYWTLRPIKDSIFHAIVHINYQPMAKGLSLFCIVPLILIYNKLLDIYPRHKVFYILISIYAAMAFMFYFIFSNPTYGLDNTVASPWRLIGWVWYVYVESFGSLLVALFWAFTTDTTKPEAARRGFPLIALFGQMGNILGPLLLNTRRLNLSNSAPLVLIAGFVMLATGVLFYFFMSATPQEQLVSYEGEGEGEEKKEDKKEESEPGFFEGLKLLLTEGYLLGIFAIIAIYEVIVTVFDYHFKYTVMSTFATEAEQSAYLSNYGVWTGIVATTCILLGINSIQRILGMRASLLLLPILVTGAVIVLKFYPFSIGIAFWVMVLAKAINYALNQPTLKQLYIPTTKDTKYKAQAWIEMFGSRGSKGVASILNFLRGNFFIAKYGMTSGVLYFMTLSTIASMGFIGLWLFVALYVSKTYDKAIKEDKVVC